MHTTIFSAHDTTVAAFLSVLGVENWHLPEYVSHVTLLVRGPVGSRELGRHTIEIRYDGESVDTDACLSRQCSLKNFMEHRQDLRVRLDSCEFT